MLGYLLITQATLLRLGSKFSQVLVGRAASPPLMVSDILVYMEKRLPNLLPIQRRLMS